MRTLGPLWVLLQGRSTGHFRNPFYKIHHVFFCYSSLFRPLFRLHMICHSEYLSISFIITTSVPSKIFKSFFACYMPQGRYCQEHGIDRNKVAQMFFFNRLASTIFRAITGRLCDLGRNVPIWIMRFTVLFSGTLVILMTLSFTFSPLLACFVVYGMMDGAIASSMNILVLSTLSTKQKSQGIGFFHLCVAVTLVAGPPLGGKLYFNTFTQSEM